MTTIQQVREFLNDRDLYVIDVEDMKKQCFPYESDFITFDLKEANKFFDKNYRYTNMDKNDRMVMSQWYYKELTDEMIEDWIKFGHDEEDFNDEKAIFELYASGECAEIRYSKAIISIDSIRKEFERMLVAVDDMMLIITPDGRLEDDHDSYVNKEEISDVLCDGRSLKDSLADWELLDENGELDADDYDLGDFFEELTSLSKIKMIVK